MKFSKIYRVMQREPRLVVPSLPRFYSILGGRQYNGTVRWYGGKYFQLKDLLPYIGELAEHNKATTFIDCCGGSAKVCINIDQSGYTFENKIYNDIDYGMACLMAVAQSPEETKKMIEYLKELGTGKEVFEYCQKNRENHDMDMFKVAAFNFFVAQCSYDATGKFYNSNRVTEEVYQRDIEKAYRFPEITSGIKVINNTYQDVFRVFGSDKQALKYMDPPYHPATRETTNVYNYEMSRDQHKEMVDILCNSRCWILSGYDPAEYGCDDYKPLEEAGAIKLSLGKYALTSGSRRRDEILHKDEIIWLKD